MRNFFTFIGEVSHFGLKGLVDAFRPPFEWEFFLIQIEEIGWQSLPLVLAAGLALGIVLSMHTRGTLVQFGAEAMIPTLQSASIGSSTRVSPRGSSSNPAARQASWAAIMGSS